MPATLDIEAARLAIEGLVRRTPLVAAPELSERAGGDCHLKLECLQVTGSFKVRGAAARMLALSQAERAAGVIACSSGNHALAVAWVARRLGISALLSVPRWIDPLKKAAIEETGARVELVADTYDDAERRMLERADSSGRTVIPPFDDPRVIAGQATIGIEIAADLPDLGAVVVPLSGGGLAAGVALAVKAACPGARVVAAYAERAPVMAESVKAGRGLELPEEETLAGALAGGIGLPNRYTFDLVRRLVDDFVAVGEDEIADAMRFAYRHHRLTVEGGGAVAIAALASGRVELGSRSIAAVVSGGNLEPARLAALLESA